MKLFENELELTYSIKKIRYGHYSVSVECVYKLNKYIFSIITNDTEKIDKLFELNSEATNYEQVEQNYHQLFYNDFEEKIISWMYLFEI